jgi:exodeoxyribonuclease III
MDRTDEALRILTLNVASPSRAKAERQLQWLSERPEQVFVLTEVGRGAGSELLAERMRTAGWAVCAPPIEEGERGVMICSRVTVGRAPMLVVGYLPHRAHGIALGKVEVMGVYAPSRDESVAKIARKRRFLAELLTTLGEREASRTVLIGDLNVVERRGRAVERVFQEWEFELYEDLPERGWLDAYRVLHPDRVEVSWADSEGGGYRFDHTIITADLRERLLRCEYEHEPRESELSDHSAMTLELAVEVPAPLEAHQSLEPGPPSLF